MQLYRNSTYGQVGASAIALSILLVPLVNSSMDQQGSPLFRGRPSSPMQRAQSVGALSDDHRRNHSPSKAASDGGTPVTIALDTPGNMPERDFAALSPSPTTTSVYNRILVPLGLLLGAALCFGAGFATCSKS